jgi:hypothetical protein
VHLRLHLVVIEIVKAIGIQGTNAGNKLVRKEDFFILSLDNPTVFINFVIGEDENNSVIASLL